MKTYNQLARLGTDQLKAAGVSSYVLDSKLLLAHVSGKNTTWLIAHGEDDATSAIEIKFSELIARREKREPIAYILSYTEFFGLNFMVSENVLIPRPETELLLEQVIANAPNAAYILDVGTGSGAIAIALAHNLPKAQVSASDISDAALALAKKNAKAILKNSSVKFICSNLFNNIEGKYDIITANLPYVAKTKVLEPELDYEPSLALFAEENGLAIYIEFFSSIKTHLNPAGLVYIEAEPDQHQQITKMASDTDLVKVFEQDFILGFTVS